MDPRGPRLWLVRHGETDWNVQRRVQGHTPTHLNDMGRQQARELANYFAPRTFAAAYASDLPRAAETADIILEPHRLAAARLIALRERGLGRYEGMSFDELHTARTALGLEHSGDLADWTDVPDIETNAQFSQRAYRVLNEISERHAAAPGESPCDVLVVTHGGFMARMVCEVLGIAPEIPRRFPIVNGMVLVLQWRLDAFHLLSLFDHPLLVGGKERVDTSAAKEA